MDVRQKTDRVDRLAGLRRFAIAITLFNVLGHLWFGFEQSYAQPLVSLLAAYSTELALSLSTPGPWAGPCESSPTCAAWSTFSSPRKLPAWRWECSFTPTIGSGWWHSAQSVAIASKAIFRFKVGQDYRHFFNPSNLGISVVLLCYPWVGIVPPYHFTENLGNVGTWVLPAVIICSGSMLNTVYTKRIPLAVAWVTAFILQALIRTMILGTPWLAGLVPVTGVAFLLFTFYMVTDPATTPRGLGAQIAFGTAVAAV